MKQYGNLNNKYLSKMGIIVKHVLFAFSFLLNNHSQLSDAENGDEKFENS